MKNKFIWLPVALVVVAVIGAAVWFGNTATQKGALQNWIIKKPVGKDVKIGVGVNNYPQTPFALLPNASVNIYKITSFAQNKYEGKLIATKTTLPDGSGATFIVKPGEIVNFVGFRSNEKAVRTTKWTFNYLPYKNFSPYGPSANLCQINPTNVNDIYKQSIDGELSCATSLSLPAEDKVQIPTRNVFP